MPHPALLEVAHRPWPIPPQRWTWRQTWRDLLFAHWRVPAARLRALIPDALELEERDGSAWIGVVPFRMTGVMLRPLPDMPGLSAFPELNVRTYVRHGDRSGVWFFSLDATNPVAVWAARRWFDLPYYRAAIEITEQDSRFHYDARRSGTETGLRLRYRPTGEPYRATEGTLEHWLTERYCLFAANTDGRLSITEVHHAPWPLQPAWAEIEHNTMTAPLDVDLEGPPLLHFARRLDVVVWSPEPLPSA